MSKKKFHIGPNGPGPCSASKRPCPVGGEHFDSEEAADAAYQKQKAENHSDAMVKKPQRDFPTPVSPNAPEYDPTLDADMPPDVKNDYRVGGPVPVGNDDAVQLHSTLMKEHKETLERMRRRNAFLDRGVRKGAITKEEAYEEQKTYMLDSLKTERRIKDFEAREFAWAAQNPQNLERLAGRTTNRFLNAQRAHSLAQKAYMEDMTAENKKTMDEAEANVAAHAARVERINKWVKRASVQQERIARDETYSMKFGCSASTWEHETQNYEFKSYEAGHAMYDEELDQEAKQGLELTNIQYRPADVLRRTDPAAYHQSLSAFADSRAADRGEEVADANDYADEYDDYLDETTTSLSNIGGNTLYGSTIKKRMGDYDTGFNDFADDYNIDTDLLWEKESDIQ